MKLVYAKGACSLSVHIMLRELDQNFEAIRVSLEDKKVLDSYNPKSYVPALVLEDGTLLTEAISILQYLSEANGGVYMPYGSIDRAKCTGWLSYFSSELHKGIGPLFHTEMLSAEFQKLISDKVHTRLRFVDDALSESEYLCAEFSIADMYALAIFRIMEHVGIHFGEYHWIEAYKARLESRPIIADCLEYEEKAQLEKNLNPQPLHHNRNLRSDSYKNIVN